MAAPGEDVMVTWAHPIGTRDGTLNSDAKMVNCFVEKEEGEQATIVKRPGTSYQSTITGTAQGFFTHFGTPYFIVNDVAYPFIPPSQGAGIPIPTVNNPNHAYTWIDSTTNAGLNVIQNSAGELWTFNGTTFTKVSDTNYTGNAPQFGIAFLDGVFYAMTQAGNVIGSAINDPTTWPALDFVGADRQFGTGVTVSRHLNYILAFYTAGLQVYFDANSAPNGSGIALGAVLSASYRTGAFNASTVSEINDITYFLSTTTLFGRGVHMLNGVTLQKISDPYIERILNNPALTAISLNNWSFGIQISGHSFFVLNLNQIGTTLVYDITTGVWSVWTSVVSGVEGNFVGRFYLASSAGSANGDYIQDTGTGKVMLMSPSLYTDATGPLNVTCVTPNYDWDTLNYKRFAAMFQIADTISTTIGVAFSDNDFASFNTPRTIDLSTAHKQLRNCGSSRRRAWKMTHSDNTPLRLNGMKVPTAVMKR